MSELDPRNEYERRLDERRTAATRLARREETISWSRLAVFAAGVVIAWIAFVDRAMAGWWFLLPVVVFVTLVVLHERFALRRKKLERAADFYESGLARLSGQWAGRGRTGLQFLTESHPYAGDLDLFGTGSLFERISLARTRRGEEMLSNWLLSPASPPVITLRQEAVDELRFALDLREDLAVLGEDVGTGVDPKHLSRWGADPKVIRKPALRWTALLLSVLAVLTVPSLVVALVSRTEPELTAGVAGSLWFRFGALPFVIVVIVEMLFARSLRGRVARIVAPLELAERELMLLATLLRRLERETFRSPRLSTLRDALSRSEEAASMRIERLHRLLALLESRRNMFFAPIAAILLWETQLAMAIDRWRAESGPEIAQWLDSVGEIEALSSFASYAFERPADPFPEIVDGETRFEAEGLGHPLLPVERCVRNDLRLGDELRLLIVSGSNMSGKSTMLRTVGVNTVLALAGAPVFARRLRISRLCVGASIRINDSLQEGSSRFYAEIVRLRQLLEISESGPLLFLLDEILGGTNSHDRRIGAEAVVKSLLSRGAIGLMTTHDLALSEIADGDALRAKNVHFEDHVEGGKMVFDYRMRDGVVEKSNAIALMRMVGLEV
ncbi:MAG: DNA mismatch repair protein MutS [Thermoanaerobaculia bacterium]